MEELAGEPFVHYDPENGMGVWVDEFVANQQTDVTVVPRTLSPRTAAQLAGAGMGMTIVRVSALARRPSTVVRSLEPRVHRDILAITMVPPTCWSAGSSPICGGGGCPRWTPKRGIDRWVVHPQRSEFRRQCL